MTEPGFSELTDDERLLLLELLRLELRELPVEIHHASSSTMRDQLHHRRDLVERLIRRLESSSVMT